MKLMANNSSLSQPICCFILLIMLILHTAMAARSFTERKLEDNTPPNTNSTGYEENKGQSKTGVHGSESRHAGSATGDNPPSSGMVAMPPPTSVTKVSYNTVNGPSTKQTSFTEERYSTVNSPSTNQISVTEASYNTVNSAPPKPNGYQNEGNNYYSYQNVNYQVSSSKNHYSSSYNSPPSYYGYGGGSYGYNPSPGEHP